MIGLTENAAVKVRELIESRPSPTAGLRVGVRGGGCSGFMYEIEFIEPPPEKTHRLFEYEGISLACDKKSYLFLIGTEIDWEETLMSTGFKFNTPTATGKCGCGESVAF